LIQKGIDIIPIEVKAETNIRFQSLKAFYDKYKLSFLDFHCCRIKIGAW